MRPALEELREEFWRWFPARAGYTDVMLFRLSRAEPPATRSLRLPLEHVLILL